MFKSTQKIALYFAITTSSILATIYSLPLNAQENSSQDDFGENITPEEELSWYFSSENESISLENNIEKLEAYSLSQSESETDIELLETNRQWGNKGDVEDYSFEIEVYDY